MKARDPRLVAAVAVAVLMVAGCTTERTRPVDQPPAEASELLVDQRLLVPLAQAKNLHLTADIQLADGNTDAAIAAVARILTIQFPLGTPDGEDTLLDARARLAKLYLGADRVAEARRTVDEGLAVPQRESFFLANLYTVSAEIHEADARRLDASDAAAARQARRRAVGALERSIEINSKVQTQLLQEIQP